MNEYVIDLVIYNKGSKKTYKDLEWNVSDYIFERQDEAIGEVIYMIEESEHDSDEIYLYKIYRTSDTGSKLVYTIADCPEDEAKQNKIKANEYYFFKLKDYENDK